MTVWAIIVAGVAAAEFHSRRTGCPTPSCVARQRPLLTTVTGGYLLGHLTGRLPYRLDLLRRWG